MASSSATTVEQYLAELPLERKADVIELRKLAQQHLPAGLQEAMNFGMIVYQVPEQIVGETYNGQPLVYAAIANQKQYISLYLMSVYAWDGLREDFESRYRESGLPMNIGKSCIRFKALSKLPIDVITWAMGQISMEQYVERYLEVRGSARRMKVKK